MKILKSILTAAFAMAFAAVVAQTPQPNALVRISVASLRAEPRHSAELETQALCGTPVNVAALDDNEDWLQAELPDGYKAYIHRMAVVMMSAEEIARWQKADRVVVKSVDELRVMADTIAESAVVSDIVHGSILEGRVMPGSNYTAVAMPDGRMGYLPTLSVANLSEYMSRSLSMEAVVGVVRRLTGVPYLWGGNSTKEMDCSGLTRIGYLDSGILLPRNAGAQALCGEAVSLDNLIAGDLLFFENEEGRVTHVAISLGGTHYIHASGFVHESSFYERDAKYNGRIVNFARRLTAESAAKLSVCSNSWYFAP